MEAEDVGSGGGEGEDEGGGGGGAGPAKGAEFGMVFEGVPFEAGEVVGGEEAAGAGERFRCGQGEAAKGLEVSGPGLWHGGVVEAEFALGAEEGGEFDFGGGGGVGLEAGEEGLLFRGIAVAVGVAAPGGVELEDG